MSPPAAPYPLRKTEQLLTGVAALHARQSHHVHILRAQCNSSAGARSFFWLPLGKMAHLVSAPPDPQPLLSRSHGGQAR